MVSGKKCNRCGEEKHIDEFHLASEVGQNTTDGLDYVCSRCRRKIEKLKLEYKQLN